MGAEAAFGPGAALRASGVLAGPRTALPLRGGRPAHAEAHLDRLRAGLEALDAPAAWLPAAWAEALAWATAQAPDPAEDQALRVQVDPARRALSARVEPLPAPPSPYRLLPLPHPVRTAADLRLGPHKGCLGPWHEPVLRQARAAGAQDALLVDPEGTVRETAIAAVGLESDGRLLLPPAGGRVRSLSELWDLPAWADERGWQVASGAFTLADLPHGTLWCFNALRGLWRAEAMPLPPDP